MSKVALLADTHFGARNDHPVLIEYFLKFFDDVFFPNLKLHGITHIIHVGDVLDRRKYANINTLNIFRERVFDRLEREGYTMDIILGNHDTYFRNTNKVSSTAEFYRSYKNITIYDGPVEKNLDGLDVLYIPWINQENHDETMGLIASTKAQVAMGHLEISGFLMYRGVLCETGMDRETFKRFDQVFTGHFHHKNDDGSIFFLGTPYEMMSSDAGDPRGFHIYDLATRDLQFVQNPYRLYSKIIYDDKETNYLEEDYSQYKNRFVRVVVTRKTSPHHFDAFREKLAQAGPARTDVIDDVASTDGTESREILVTQDTISVLGNYVDNFETDLDKDRLKSVLRTAYLEATNPVTE